MNIISKKNAEHWTPRPCQLRFSYQKFRTPLISQKLYALFHEGNMNKWRASSALAFERTRLPTELSSKVNSSGLESFLSDQCQS